MPKVSVFGAGECNYTPYASPVDVIITICPEDCFGNVTTDAELLEQAQIMRRTQFGIQVSTETYDSNEINASAQVVDSRNGMKSVTGSISCELSPHTYSAVWAALLRGEWQRNGTEGMVYIPNPPKQAASFTIEKYITSTNETQLFKGMRVTQAAIQCPATGLATVDFTFMGQDREIVTARVFTNPAPATSTPVLAAVSGSLQMGAVMADGSVTYTDVTDVTSFSVTIDTQASTQAVTGSNLSPDVWLGTYKITGSFSALYRNNNLSKIHDDELPLALYLRLKTDNTDDADYLGFEFNKIKITNAPEEESGQTILQNCTFTAVMNGGDTGDYSSKNSTIVIHDSTEYSDVVTVPVTGIEFSQSEIRGVANQEFKIDYTITPDNATNKGASFTSSDTSIATVDTTGTIKLVAENVNPAIITGTTQDGNFTDTITVYCQAAQVPLTSVTVTVSPETAEHGMTYEGQAIASTLPADATGVVVVYSMSGAVTGLDIDPDTGEITGTPSAAGTVTITATATDDSDTPEITDTATITVS